jgi:hypothetical protein
MTDGRAATPELVITAFAGLIASRRAALERTVYISVAMVDGGEWHLDTGAEVILRSGWNESAELKLVTDSGTLAALLVGAFDHQNPELNQIFLWSGDPTIWGALAQSFAGSRTGLSLRAERSKE